MKKIIILGFVVAIIVAVFLYLNREPKETCSIEPPPTTKVQDRDRASSLAADLKQMKGSADLEQKFRVRAQTAYAEISETNTTLLLLLNAANCFAEKDPATSKRLADTAIQLAKAKYGIAGGAEQSLSATAVQQIQRGPDGAEILQILKNSYGYKLAGDQ